MDDKIIKVAEEIGEMTVNFKDGSTQKVAAITTYTYWESGRKDCKISLLKPIDAVVVQPKI